MEPTPGYVGLLEEILRDEGLSHLYLDLSWDVVAEQIVGSPATLAAWVALVNAWPNRFVLGSDSVVTTDADAYLGALEAWRPLLDGLDPDASEKVRLRNYERLFDARPRAGPCLGGRPALRVWERRPVLAVAAFRPARAPEAGARSDAAYTFGRCGRRSCFAVSARASCVSAVGTAAFRATDRTGAGAGGRGLALDPEAPDHRVGAARHCASG